MRCCISKHSGGRPGRERQRQSKRKARVCQRFTVSGFIRCTRSSQPSSSFESATQSMRKAGVNWRRRCLALTPAWFRATASWLSAASRRAASTALSNTSAKPKRNAWRASSQTAPRTYPTVNRKPETVLMRARIAPTQRGRKLPGSPGQGFWGAQDTIGLYDPATGTYYLRNSNAAGAADLTFHYGPAPSTRLPLAGILTGSCRFPVRDPRKRPAPATVQVEARPREAEEAAGGSERAMATPAQAGERRRGWKACCS